MPNMIIIAGPNGAGKSTSAPALLQQTAEVDDFVNADVIAKGLCAFQPEKEAMHAGRIMLERIHHLADKNCNFAFETTLATRSFANWMKQLKMNGYQMHLFFLWLNSEELAIHRVSERVKLGGHHIPTGTVKRRYHSGIKNFFNLYLPLLDQWSFYDNSNSQDISLIASENNGQITIENNSIWETLKETYHE